MLPAKWVLPIIFALAAILVAFHLAPRGVSADYRVAIRAPGGPDTECDVFLDLNRVPRNSLVLFIAADRTALPLKDFRVTDERGTPLPFTQQDRIISLSGEKHIS